MSRHQHNDPYNWLALPCLDFDSKTTYETPVSLCFTWKCSFIGEREKLTMTFGRYARHSKDQRVMTSKDLCDNTNGPRPSMTCLTSNLHLNILPEFVHHSWTPFEGGYECTQSTTIKTEGKLFARAAVSGSSSQSQEGSPPGSTVEATTAHVQGSKARWPPHHLQRR